MTPGDALVTYDEAAAVMERLRNSLEFVARSYVTDADAEDVVQEAYVKAWASPRLATTAVMDAARWLRRIVINEAIDTTRRRARLPVLEQRWCEWSEAACRDAVVSPEDAAEASEAVLAWDRVLRRYLPAEESVVMLLLWRGWRHADVAGELGLTTRRVSVLEGRALALLALRREEIAAELGGGLQVARKR